MGQKCSVQSYVFFFYMWERRSNTKEGESKRERSEKREWEKYGGSKPCQTLCGSLTFIMSVSMLLVVTTQLEISASQQRNQGHCQRLDLHYKNTFHRMWPGRDFFLLFVKVLPSFYSSWGQREMFSYSASWDCWPLNSCLLLLMNPGWLTGAWLWAGLRS